MWKRGLTRRAASGVVIAGLCSMLAACGGSGAGQPAALVPSAFPTAVPSTGASDLIKQRVEDMFQRFDLNHDGFLDSTEVTLKPQDLAAIDTNHDGKISRDELTQYLIQQTGGNLDIQPAPTPPPSNGSDDAFTNNQIQLFVDAEEIYPHVYQALHEAQKSIQIDLYLLGGAVGRTIANELVAKQRQGVDVRVMTDPNLGFGGSTQEGMVAVVNYLRDNHVPFKTYPLQYLPRLPGALANKFQIDHDKIIVIDRSRLLIGSMNMFDGALPNHDIHFEIDGPLAEHTAQLLDKQWGLPNNPYIAPPSPRPLHVNGMAPVNASVRLTRTDIDVGSTKPVVLDLINHAQRSIDIAMFEFSDQDVIRAVREASLRGVQVRVILDPNVTDKYTALPVPAGMPNMLPVRDFMEIHLPVRWFRPFKNDQELHMKLAIFDGQTVIAGSTNFTAQAFTTFRETSIEIQSPEMAAQLEAMFERDWNIHTTPITKLSFSDELLAGTIESMEASNVQWW